MSEVKKLGEMTKTEKHAIVLKALEKEGYNSAQAANLIGVSRQYAHQITGKINNGSMFVPLIAKAQKSIARLASGKTVGNMVEVKGSDVLGALKLIVDRVEPAVQRVQSTSLRITEEITPQDRAKYQKLLGIAPIPDAEFTPVEETPQLEDK